MEFNKSASSSLKKGDKLNLLSDKETPNQAEDKKKKQKIDISKEIVINFRYEDFEPIEKKYKPQFRKNSNYRYFCFQETIDILDQNRFKFILNLEVDEQSYNKYLYSSSSNLKWEDIYIVICYLENIHTCAICLDKKLVCPVITRCGHIFCWPCIDNYYEYWTVAAINKKQPKCPLCKDLINPEELKICEIIQCVNYVEANNLNANLNPNTNNVSWLNSSNVNEHNLDRITFNLVLKEKRGQVLYNVNCDPDLSYFKGYYLNENNDSLNPNSVMNAKNKAANSSKKFVPNFNFIPLEKAEEFGFSRIFTTTKEYIVQRLFDLQKDLEENLKEELDGEQDQRRIQSLTKCIELMKLDIDYYNYTPKENDKENEKDEDKEKVQDKSKGKEKNKSKNSAEKEKALNNKINSSSESNNNNNDNLNNTKDNVINLSSNEDKKITINPSNTQTAIENLSTVDEDSQNLNKLNYITDLDAQKKIDLKNYFFFYQESRGDIYLLHPIDYQILLKEYELEDHLPTHITAKILEIEPHQVTDYIKNKYAFLSHMRIGSLFYFVEIDMRNLVSNHTLKNFQNVLKERSKIRHSIKREEENYENYVQTIKSSEELIMNQTFQKYNSFREKLKNKEFVKDKENSDEENAESPNREESSVKNEQEDTREKSDNTANKGGNLKALFTGEWEEMQKKKEQELAKQNKKKFIPIENLPTLGNLNNFNTPIEDNLDLNKNDSNNKFTLKDLKEYLGNENKDVNLTSNANNFNIPNTVIVPNKKGSKKANAKKKFVNLDFGAKLGFQKEEEDNQDIDDMPEEDILLKNLANKKPKEIKKSTFATKAKK